MVGPATNPNSPNTSSPPSTPINNSNSFRWVRLRNNNGRITLSATAATPPQITTISAPFPQCPVNPSHNAAGTQISAEPTTGTSEKNAISTPQNTAVGSPVMVKASPPRNPCKPAIINPTATQAKIKSVDSLNISRCIDSSRGSK